MTVLALDCSKYTKTVNVGVIQQWQAAGVGLLVIQAHPAGYGQERSLEITRAAQAGGMPWDFYIYGYLGYTDWLPGALATLDLAAAEGLLPRKGWLDVEDVDSGKGWTAAQRVGAVQRDLGLCDAWLANHGRPATAIYSAKWYWDPYMGSTTQFSDRQLWAAQYDNIADASVFTPFGGWATCRIKQYAGSQPDGTDLDVLSIEEEAELTDGGPPVEDAERKQYEDTIAGLVSSLGYLAGDALAPVVAQKQKSSKAVQQLVGAIRSQADAHGIQHA